MSGKDEDGEAGQGRGGAATGSGQSVVPRRRTMLEMAADSRRIDDARRAPERAAAREKALRQAHEARGAGLEALMQLIMGHPGVRDLVTPTDGKRAFELTPEEAAELSRRDLKRQRRGNGSQPHQRRRS